MRKELEQLIPQERCLACDGCCRFSCAESEWRPKAESADEEVEMYVDRLDDSQYLKVEKEGDICKCTLLDLDTNKCAIYDDRPFECRLYPFLLVKDEGKMMMAVHLGCPSVQDALGTEAFDQYVKKLQDYCCDSEVKVFLKENADLAGEYSDYQKEIKQLFAID